MGSGVAGSADGEGCAVWVGMGVFVVLEAVSAGVAVIVGDAGVGVSTRWPQPINMNNRRAKSGSRYLDLVDLISPSLRNSLA